ncbi:MAG TPA: adenosylcobinamide-GDP ribazoletransferase [Actinomycetota bacterium]|jgi:adenosylcobinamide-GDP ribazoletransferase
MRAREGGRGFASAISFLTRFPLGSAAYDGNDLARGLPFFPLVGAAVGAGVALVAIGAGRYLPPLIAAFLAVTCQALVTGGLHLDGLADSADSYGARDRQRALEIMRDPSVGSFGTIAVVLDVGIKAAAIAALLERSDALGPLVAATTLGSLAFLPGLLLPYAGGGTGRFLAGARPIAAIGAVAAAGIIVGFSIGLQSFAAVGIAVTVDAFWSWHSSRRLGGITGDTLGAGAELVQLAVLLTLVATLT